MFHYYYPPSLLNPLSWLCFSKSAPHFPASFACLDWSCPVGACSLRQKTVSQSPSHQPAGRAQLTSPFGRRREFKVTNHPSNFEVCLYAVLLAMFALRDFKKPSNAVDEAALVQRVDAAIADFEGTALV